MLTSNPYPLLDLAIYPLYLGQFFQCSSRSHSFITLLPQAKKKKKNIFRSFSIRDIYTSFSIRGQQVEKPCL